MSEELERRRRLEELDAKLKAAKQVEPQKRHSDEHYSKAHLAWRMVIELVAGIAIGFGIGYGLDYYLGTMPLFLVLFILLGLAAGIKTMMRSAKELQTDDLGQAVTDDEDD